MDAAEEPEVVLLKRWEGPWSPDDPDANFKTDVASYSRLDPMATIRGLSRNVNIPEGAIARYVLAKFATSGSGGLLELGPTMVHRLWQPIEDAEREGTTAARLVAYDQLKQMIEWLRLPLIDEDIYTATTDE